MDEQCLTINVCDASVCIPGAELLRNVSFGCCEGEWTLLVGPSGAGKSTLLRLLNGLCTPTSGYVQTLGTTLPGRSGKQARAVWRQCGTVFQDVALFDTKTVLQNVELGARAAGVSRLTARERARGWLERLGLGDKLDEHPSRLSGGQRQRVALARAFVGEPRVLLLDEPTSALDKGTARVALEALGELVARGTTIVMASHQTDEVIERCDQVIGLDGGHIERIERVRCGVDRVHLAAAS